MAATITYEQKRRSKELLELCQRYLAAHKMTLKEFHVLSGIPYTAVQEWSAGTKPLPPKWHDVACSFLISGT